MVAGASTVIGGPIGRTRVARRSWWTPLRVVLLLAILASALGAAIDSPVQHEGLGRRVRARSAAAATATSSICTGGAASTRV